MIGALVRNLAERIAIDRRLRLRRIAQQRQAKRRSLAARRDRHLRSRAAPDRSPRLRSTGLSTTVCESSCSWKLTPLGRSRWRNSCSSLSVQPAIASRIVDHELVGGRFDAQSEIAPLEQRALMQQLHQALDAPALLIELRIAPGHADRQHGQRDDHGHDHHDHQDLDQREASAAHGAAPAERAAYLCSRVEVLMSAS